MKSAKLQKGPPLAGLPDASPVFAALGDPTRFSIVTRLCRNGPLSVVRLTEGADVSRQAISKHLRALSEAGLVSSRRAGRERVWAIETRRLEEVRRYLEQIAAQWDDALGRLRKFVEAERD
jgi:DNA-binding transcriptional ArsR family regulator